MTLLPANGVLSDISSNWTSLSKMMVNDYRPDIGSKASRSTSYIRKANCRKCYNKIVTPNTGRS